jgi:hypothetical protein
VHERTADRVLAALAVAWVAAVALVEAGGVLDPAAVASSPDAVAAGELWTLLTSGLVVDDAAEPVQLLIGALLTALVLVRDGGVTWWLAALAGHVGSALIAYAAIAIADVLGSTSAERFAGAPDYGVSCVLCALNGVAFVGAARRIRARRGGAIDWIVAAGTVIATVGWLATLDWYGVEHLYAFGIGAAVAAVRSRGTG